MAEYPNQKPDSNLPPDGGSREPKPIEPAPLSLRFANYLLDQFFCAFFSMPLFALLAMIFGEAFISELESRPQFFIFLPILLIYYIFFEMVYGKTPGKFITKTVVVDEKGRKPGSSQIVIRSLARIIPFEPFSFFLAPPRGWHDSLSKTYVVKDDVRASVQRDGLNKQQDDVFTA